MSINASKVSPSQASEMLLAHAISQLSGGKRHKPVYLWGTYGVGKSSIVKQLITKISAHFDKPVGLLDVRLSQFDAVDTRGIPYIRDQRDALDAVGNDEMAGMSDEVKRAAYQLLSAGPSKTTEWSTPSWLPNVARDGEFGILFLDEIQLACQSVKNAGYQLLNEFRLGDYILPAGWFVIAASNRPNDGAGVSGRMDAAVSTRFKYHLDVMPSAAETTDYFQDIGVRPEVIAFLKFRGEAAGDQAGLIHEFPNGGTAKDKVAIATPRTWESVSDILDDGMAADLEHIAIEGAIGAGAAGEFIAFLRTMRNLPDIGMFLSDPHNVPLPNEITTQYAVTAALAARVTADSLGNGVTVVSRINNELLEVFWILATRRDPDLKASPEYVAHKATH
jgi:hypothetical protein